MKQYRVIALSVGGLGNKIFNSGDTVQENNFIQGRAEELVRQGFLQCIEDGPAEQALPPMPDNSQPETFTDSDTTSDTGSSETSNDAQEGSDSDSVVDMVKSLVNGEGSETDQTSEAVTDSQGANSDSSDEEELDGNSKVPTVKEMKEDLTNRGISFPKSASKAELYELWSK